MRSKKRGFFTLVIFIISVAVGYYVVRKIDVSIILNLKIETISFILLGYGGVLFVRLLAVKIFLKDMGYECSIKTLFLILVSSYTVNYISPVKIGFPLRVYLYKKVLNIPAAIGTSLFAVISFVEVNVLTLLSLLGIIFFLHRFRYYLPAISVLILFILTFWILVFNCQKISKFFIKLPFKSKIKRVLNFMDNVQIGVKQVKMKSFTLIFVLFLLRMFISAFCSYFILSNFRFVKNIFHLLYIQSISFVAGFISMLPMGIFAKDVTVVVLLSQIGVSQDAAVSLAIVERLLWTVLPLLLGIVAINFLGIKLWGLKREEEIEMVKESNN